MVIMDLPNIKGTKITINHNTYTTTYNKQIHLHFSEYIPSSAMMIP